MNADVTRCAASSPDREAPFGWRVVLGLAEPGLDGWEKVRRAQIVEISRLLPMICFANLAGALLLVVILEGAAPPWELRAWLGALLAGLLLAARASHAGRNEHADISVATVRSSALHAGALGMLWAIPALCFSGTGTIAQQLAICLISAGVIGMAPLTISAVPCAMLAFVAVAGGGLTAMMVKADSALLTVIAVLFAASLAIGGAISGRAFLRRKWAETSLAEQTELVSLLLREFEENSADWLWQVDCARRLENVHPRLARAAGREAASLEGMPLFQLLAGDAWENGLLSAPLRDLLTKLNDRESFSDLDLPVTIGGDQRWWRLSAAPRHDERGAFAGFRGVGSDVTEQRRSADRINRMARYDALTSLANRVHFTDSLRKALEKASGSHLTCALMLIDLDKFKAVNDTLGHPMGDKLLRAASQRLTGLVREGDICGRLGGDEFAILFADAIQIDRLDDLSQAVIAAMARPFEIEGHLIQIGASVGTAIGPRDGRTVEMLMRNADLALYRSKEDGRGRHRRFQPRLLARAERRRVLEAALREAMDAGQFRLAYQPIVDARDARVCGLEALLRWTHPELGEVSPADFLPIAEKARLLGSIGDWVLREACAEAARWPRDIRLYVNLAAEQLHDPAFPATMEAVLARTGLPPGRLELEIPESMLLRDIPEAIAALERIQALGTRVALDNFGTGHSSLGHVRQSRFSTIKVDRSLIASAARHSAESVGLIRAVVAMADTLGLVTIAQGAETHAERTLARELGCRQVQGHVVGAPMPAAEARALLGKGKARKVA